MEEEVLRVAEGVKDLNGLLRNNSYAGRESMKKESIIIHAAIALLFLIIIHEMYYLIYERQYNEPAIYENIVVLKVVEDENQSIYDYDLTEKRGFLLLQDKDEKVDISIFDNIVVWNLLSKMKGQDYLCDSIYGYDLVTKEKFKITENGYNGCTPSIYNKIVVNNEYWNGRFYISAYDLSSRV
jgi:hypothetical protein